MRIKLTDFFAVKYSQLSGGNISAKRAVSLAGKIKSVSNFPTQLLKALEKKDCKHPELKINGILSKNRLKNNFNIHQAKAKGNGGSSRCQSGKHDLKINFNPLSAAPLEYTKAVSIESKIISDNEVYFSTFGFISNVNGTGEPGLRLHGMEEESYLTWKKNTSSENNLMKDSTVIIKDGAYIITTFNESNYIMTSPEGLYYFFLDVKNIDLKTVSLGKPLHLLACFSNSKKSMAQSLANFLQRPVVGYGEGEGEGGIIYTCDIKEHLYVEGSINAHDNDKNNINLKETVIEQDGGIIPARKIYYFPEKL